MVAALLTKARAASVRSVFRDKRPLKAAIAVYKGGLAAVNASGFFGPATGATTEIVVGRFYESVDNTAGANGDKYADIQHFRERALFLVDNDSVAPVTVASRERVCSVLDDHTATLRTLAASNLGIVYDVTTEGVWLDISAAASSGAAGSVPTVQAGTTTLIAGTKTVTGVTLTASSSIQLAMRDPGAGALTTFIALDAPVATRNTATGQFVINAIDNAKAVLATAVSTVDYLIVG